MFTEKKEVKKKDYPIVLAPTKGKLHVTKQLMEQINTLHLYAGNVEWSGPLFYTVKKGSISDPTSIEVEAIAMYPMDIGTSGYTEYDFEPDQTFDMHDFYPEIVNKSWNMGHIHTHHSMNTFFSDTDDQELRDNTTNHAYYLSLIVNHAKKYSARLCVMGKRVVKGDVGISYKGFNGKNALTSNKITQEIEVVYAIDLDITLTDSVSPFMVEVEKIKSRKLAKEEEARKSRFTGSKWSELGRDSHLEAYGQGWHNPTGKGQMDMFETREERDARFREESRFPRTFKDVKVPDEVDPIEQANAFICKIISGGDSFKVAQTVLEMHENSFMKATETEKELFAEVIAERFHKAYLDHFADVSWDNFYDNMTVVMDVLNDSALVYSIAQFLIDELLLYDMPEEDELEIAELKAEIETLKAGTKKKKK